MIALSAKIIAYLSVNNISYTVEDFQTAQPEGEPDQILYWDEEKLGSIPTEEQLDESYVIWEGQQIAQENKQKAIELLKDTDWTATIDISNPEYSDPYLTNQNEFLSYRAALRTIAVNPPTTPAVFPDKPQEQWSN